MSTLWGYRLIYLQIIVHILLLITIVLGFSLAKVFTLVRLLSIFIGFIYYFFGILIVRWLKLKCSFFLPQKLEVNSCTYIKCIINILITQPFSSPAIIAANLIISEKNYRVVNYPKIILYFLKNMLIVLVTNIAIFHFDIFFLYRKTFNNHGNMDEFIKNYTIFSNEKWLLISGELLTVIQGTNEGIKLGANKPQFNPFKILL
jgi:hypothetical protein